MKERIESIALAWVLLLALLWAIASFSGRAWGQERSAPRNLRVCYSDGRVTAVWDFNGIYSLNKQEIRNEAILKGRFQTGPAKPAEPLPVSDPNRSAAWRVDNKRAYQVILKDRGHVISESKVLMPPGEGVYSGDCPLNLPISVVPPAFDALLIAGPTRASFPAYVPPPAVKRAPPKRIRVGGNVAKARLVHQVRPQYPSLARKERVSGTVKFSAVIGKDGSMLRVDVMSGHPLLVPAAAIAVWQWKYKRTMLNGEPVEVLTNVDVNFTLADDRAPVIGVGRRGTYPLREKEVFEIGDTVTSPKVIRRYEPEYSDKARGMKVQGTVLLAVEVWEDGRAHNIRVLRSVEPSLDEEAKKAVYRWYFEPGRKDGKPVRVAAQIQVSFRLL